MKRGRDEEKNMGPMFPRLHANDTEKGGPRAPPRNKMALYEQLSIPSQRFNYASLPANSNKSNKWNIPSSSQGRKSERGIFLPHQLPPSVHSAGKTTLFVKPNPALVQIEPKKRQVEEDFMVPIFVQSNKGQDCNGSINNMVKERRSTFSSADSDRFVKFQDTSERVSEQLDTSGHNLRQENIKQGEGIPKKLVAPRDTSNSFASEISLRDKSESPLKLTSALSSFNYTKGLPNYVHRLNDNNDSLQHEYMENVGQTKSVGEEGVSIDHYKEMDHRNSSILVEDLQEEEHRSPNSPVNDAESREDNCRSFQTANLDRDDASETSMVDSMSGTHLSPDDVVGVIGQKHFWKARRAIVNQQRVFAVQVFELHRLIKVQRLIAKSPHILLEDSVFLRKPPKVVPEKSMIPLDYIVKDTPKIKHKDIPEKPDNRMESSAENAVEKTSITYLQNDSQPSGYTPFIGKPHPTIVNPDPKVVPEKSMIPLDYIVKDTPKIVKHKDIPEKPDNRMESSAENAVEKTSITYLQNDSQPSGYTPFIGKPHPTIVNPDPNMSSWGFNQPSGHQWLVPVMTPSEGLVYKPYPAPGFVGTFYGPPGSIPMRGNYPNYGAPIPHHPYQGFGPTSFASPASHGYFPPFGTSVMHPPYAGSAENLNHINMLYQASCNVPSQKNGTDPNAVKLNPSKDTEVQASTASSPSDQRTRRTKAVNNASEGRNVLPLFPTSAVTHAQVGGVEKPTRVIKVVPRNAILATESVARIFQSIQEERAE